MGCFSWLFADKDNKTNLRIDRKGYIACPDGSFIKVRRKTPAFRHGDIRRRKRDRFTNLHCSKIVNVV